MSDIVERLRQAANGHPYAKIAWPHRVLIDAAHEIERLRVALKAGNSPEIPDSSSIVHSLIPPDWDNGPYSVASELKRLLVSVADHGTSIDSGTMDGQAHLWVTIGGSEYFIAVEKALGASKNNPFAARGELVSKDYKLRQTKDNSND